MQGDCSQGVNSTLSETGPKFLHKKFLMYFSSDVRGFIWLCWLKTCVVLPYLLLITQLPDSPHEKNTRFFFLMPY